MVIAKVMSKLTEALFFVLHIVAFIALMVMMLIVTANIIGRIFLKTPIMGTLEITGFAGVVVVSFAIGFAQRDKRNVYMDILVVRFSPIIRYLVDAVTSILSLIIIGFMFWAVTESAIESFLNEEVTITLSVMTYPYRFAWAAGLLVLCGFLLQNFIRNLFRSIKK